MSNAAATPPKPRARRWVRVLTALLLIVFVLVAAAPSIITKTPLLNLLARKALADVHGHVSIGDASLGWFSSLEMRDTRITDLENRPVATVPRVQISKSLLGLLISSSELGEIVIEEPVIEIASDRGRTNLEQVFAKYLEPDSTSPSPQRTSLSVRVVNGKLHLRDRQRDIHGVEATVKIPAPRSEPIAIAMKASVVGTPTTGSLDFQASLGNSSEAKLHAVGFPLEILDPFLVRVDPTLSLAGSLHAEIRLSWNADFSTIRIDGAPRVNDLDLKAAWLRGDRLRLASFEMPVKAEATAASVRIDTATLTCDLGKASLKGEFTRGGGFEHALDRPGVTLAAELDLAKLAKALPRWTSLREGTVVRSGSIAVSVESTASPQGTTWAGSVNAADLRAIRDGQPIEWLAPLSLEFRGRFPDGGLPTIDTLVCRSDIVAFQARGTPESFKAAANIFLDRLTARLGEFIRLDGLALDGQAVVRAEVTRVPATGAVTATGSIDLTNFVFADAAGIRYREPKLDVRLSSAGQYHANTPSRIDSGSVTISAADDSLELRLLEPLVDAAKLDSGKLTLKLIGDLARWRSRASGFVALPAAWKLEGQGNVLGTLRLTPDRFTVENLACSFDRFVFQGEGADIREPKLNVQGSVDYLRKTGTIEARQLDLLSASVAATAPKMVVEALPNGTRAIAGEGTFNVDLTAIERWLGMADPRGPGTLAGRANGQFKLRAVEGVTEFQANCDVKDFAVGPKTAPTWAEPKLTLAFEGSLDPVRDEFRLRRGRIDRDGLGVTMDGTYSMLQSTQDLAFQGTLSYDLDKLTPLLRGLVGGNLQASGAGTRPFKLTGRLMPPGAKTPTFADLNGEAGLTWRGVQAYGFDVGPGEVNAKLARGVVTTNRIDAAFGGGAAHVTPTLRLVPEPLVLSVEKGTIIERARLTPKSAAGAIGYALPVVANAVQADGQISFTIADNSIPLADLTKATLKGNLFVHKANVGTGPIIAEIATLLGASSTSVTLANDMAVPIKVENGRVHHENLRLTVNGYAVTTNGSVGFDGSVALIADVPIPANNMFKNNPRLVQALTGKSLKVPIAGTLAKPMLDRRGFDNAMAQLVKDATKSAATDLIKSGLDKLLTPKK